ncbi:MAG: hypothetical protein IPO14_08800 [Saprospiraceae bacterium]|nr:hypothetical protein [Saprospiraceae bacterium]
MSQKIATEKLFLSKHIGPNQFNPNLYSCRYLNHSAIEKEVFSNINDLKDDIHLFVQGSGMEHYANKVAQFTLEKIEQKLNAYLELPSKLQELESFLRQSFMQVHNEIFRYSLERLELLGAEAALVVVVIRKNEIIIAANGPWIFGNFEENGFKNIPLNDYSARLGSTKNTPKMFFKVIKNKSKESWAIGTDNTIDALKSLSWSEGENLDLSEIESTLLEAGLMDFQAFAVVHAHEEQSIPVELTSALPVETELIFDENEQIVISQEEIPHSINEKINNAHWFDLAKKEIELSHTEIDTAESASFEPPIVAEEDWINGPEDLQSIVDELPIKVPIDIINEEPKVIANLTEDSVITPGGISQILCRKKIPKESFRQSWRKHLSSFGIVMAIIAILGFAGPAIEKLQLNGRGNSTQKPDNEDIVLTKESNQTSISPEDALLLEKEAKSLENLKSELIISDNAQKIEAINEPEKWRRQSLPRINLRWKV